MAAAAKEAAEDVKWVVVAAAAALLLVLLQAVVAVLVVDLARLGVAEGLVGFGYLDKLVLGGFIAAAWLLVMGGDMEEA